MPRFRTMEISYPAKDFETATVSDTAAGVTASKIGEACFITVETASIRYCLDGTVPNATTGHLVSAGGYIWLANKNAITNLSMVRATASNATIMVTHF